MGIHASQSDCSLISLYIYTNNIIHSTTIFNIVRLLNPEEVEHCAKDLQRVQGEYIVLRLDFIWSIDRHNKLAV
jgi:hypothetical protein